MSNFVLTQFLWLFKNGQIWLQDDISSFSFAFSRHFQLGTIYHCFIRLIWKKIGIRLSYVNTDGHFQGFSSIFFCIDKILVLRTLRLRQIPKLSVGPIYCRFLHPSRIKFGTNFTHTNAHGHFSSFCYI